MKDLQRKVIGTLLLFKDAYFQVSDILQPELFTDPDCNEAFYAINKVVEEGKRIDITTVNQVMRKPLWLTEVTENINSGDHLLQWVLMLQENYKKTQFQKIVQNAFTRSENEDIFEVMDNTLNGLYSLSQPVNTQKEEIATDIIDKIVKNFDKGVKTGVKSGLDEFDKVTNGFHNSDLIIIAARPGMGKSALSTTIALNCNTPMCIFSMEMSKIQVTSRLVASKLGIDVNRILYNNVGMNDKERIKDCKLEHIVIDDSSGLTISQLRTRCNRYFKMYGIKLIVVDYLQLMSGGANYKGNRDQEIGEISRGLKQIAKELDVPVIALSQLSRAVESTQDKKPKLSHLRESGNIEQDADIVCFLWRPDYYGIVTDEGGSVFPNGYTEISIQKHRNGGLANIPVKFLGSHTKFVNLENDISNAIF